MEVMVDSSGVLSSPIHLQFAEVILGESSDNPAFVHAMTGDGNPTFVRFVNGCPPSLCKGTKLSMWAYENDILPTGLAGFRIDLKGPCSWLWKMSDDDIKKAEPAFGELFAGLGGWTKGLHSMQKTTKVLVEIDRTVAQACADCLHIPLITVEDAYKNICNGQWPEKCVLLGDLMEVRTWTVLAFFRIQHICMSPPCPPWSKASWESGLQVKEGRVFAQVFRLAPYVGVKVFNIENVASIVVHPHFKHLMKFAKEQHYDIVHSVVIDSFPFLPIRRERWLASFCNESYDIPQISKEWASNVKFPCLSQGVATVGNRDCVQEHFAEGEWNDMLPCPQAIIMMNQDEYLPKQFERIHGHSIYQSRICTEHMPIGGAMAMYGKQHTLPIELLRQKGLFTSLFRKEGSTDPPRYYTAWEFLSAMQWPMDTLLPVDKHDAWHAAGNAICIPHTVLCLFRMHACMGDASPWGSQFLSLKKICWNIVEKSIKLSNMIPESIGELKRLTFVDSSESSEMITPKKRVHECELGAQILSPCQAGTGKTECQKSDGAVGVAMTGSVDAVGTCDNPNAFETEAAIEKDSREELSDEIPSGGGSKHITGTFTQALKQTITEIDLESDDGSISPKSLHNFFERVANESKRDRVFKKRPYNDEDTWHFEIGSVGEFCKGDAKFIKDAFAKCSHADMKKLLSQALNRSGLSKIWPMSREVLLINPINMWSRITLVGYGKNHEFLPFARPEQFRAVRVNTMDVLPLSVPPGIDELIIAFVPVETKCEVVMPDGSKIHCKVDVTTRFYDVACEIQNMTGMHCDSVVFFQEGIKLRMMEHVCTRVSCAFSVHFQAVVRMPSEIPVATMKPEVVIPPSHSDIMISAKDDMIRFAVRHPVWSSIRTTTASIHDDVHSMLRQLLPDMKNTCQVTLGCQECSNLNDITIGHLNFQNGYEINFNASKPYPTARLEFVRVTSVADQMNLGKKTENAENMVCRWIRTPFQTKAYEQWFESNITICKLAAMYFAHCQSQQTIIALVDGKMIDPRTTLDDVSKDKVLTFRACPLVGGGKEKDKDVKKILWDQFSTRGVPNDLVQSRVDGFLSKVSPDKIRTHAGETWARQWVSLKQLANEARFRLITTDELRAFQSKKKSDRSSDATSASSAKPSTVGSSVSTRQPSNSVMKKLNLHDMSGHHVLQSRGE